MNDLAIKKLEEHIKGTKRLLKWSEYEYDIANDAETKEFYRGQVKSEKFQINKLERLLREIKRGD